MTEWTIIDGADPSTEMAEAIDTMDWGVLIEEAQEGNTIYILGNSREKAHDLLLLAADKLKRAEA